MTKIEKWTRADEWEYMRDMVPDFDAKRSKRMCDAWDEEIKKRKW